MDLLNSEQARDSDNSEGVLVQRAAAGDAEAFAGLYERHAGAVFRYFHYRVGHREDAEDLTGQVFLKAWQAISGYDYRGIPFSAWLFRIAHNQLVDAKRNHRETVELDEALELQDGTSTPEELALARIEAQELGSAFRQLSPVEQSVVALRFVDGLDHRAVSGTINKSEVATRSIQSRALARLARYLKVREGGTVLARVTAAVAALLFLFGITAVAASEALPPSPLYSTKLALEDLRLAVARGDAERLQLRLEMSERRVSELSAVADTATAADFDRVAGRYQETVRSVVREAAGISENSGAVAGVESTLVEEEAQLAKTLARLSDADPAKRAAVQQALGVAEQERVRLQQSEGAGSPGAPEQSDGPVRPQQQLRQRQAPSFETPPSPAPVTEEPVPSSATSSTPVPSPQAQYREGNGWNAQGVVLDATPVPAPPVPGAGYEPGDPGTGPAVQPTAGFAADEFPSGEQGSRGQAPSWTSEPTPAGSSPAPDPSAGGAALQQGESAAPGPPTQGGPAPVVATTEPVAAPSPPTGGTAVQSPAVPEAISTAVTAPAPSATPKPNAPNGAGGSQSGTRSGGRR